MDSINEVACVRDMWHKDTNNLTCVSPNEMGRLTQANRANAKLFISILFVMCGAMSHSE